MGDVNVHVTLRHMHILRYVTGALLSVLFNCATAALRSKRPPLVACLALLVLHSTRLYQFASDLLKTSEHVLVKKA